MPVTVGRRRALATLVGVLVGAAGGGALAVTRSTCGAPVWNWQGLGRCAQRLGHTGSHH